MFSTILKGKDLKDLNDQLNQFICDYWQPKPDMLDEPEGDQKVRLKFYNIQQFVVGEVDPKSVSIINQQPVPKFSFCLLLICGYEPTQN